MTGPGRVSNHAGPVSNVRPETPDDGMWVTSRVATG